MTDPGRPNAQVEFYLSIHHTPGVKAVHFRFRHTPAELARMRPGDMVDCVVIGIERPPVIDRG